MNQVPLPTTWRLPAGLLWSVVAPAALFLVSVLSTWWLYRRFAREEQKRD